MGFFQDLKEDLSIAVDELAAEGAGNEGAPMTQEEIASSLSAMTEAGKQAVGDQVQENDQETGQEAVKEEASQTPSDDMDVMPDDELKEALEAAGVVEGDTKDAISPDGKPAPVFGQQMELDLSTGDKPAASKKSDTIEAAANELKNIANIVNKDAPASDVEKFEEKQTGVIEDVVKLSEAQETAADQNAGQPAPVKASELNGQPADESAVITSCMTVNGDIISRGSIEIQGVVEGNVTVLGKLNVSGRLTGDAKAAEVFADGAQISGHINADGTAKVGKDSVIIGNIFATSAVIAGAVKGDIDVHGPVILDSSAIVMGNIRSKSVQINNGAAIEGLCSQCYADNSPSSFFDKLLK